MKKPYSKPMVSFESYSLDMPIAVGCDPNATGAAKELEAQGFFGNDCYDVIDDNFLDSQYGVDKICYYSMAAQLFTS